MKERSNAEDDLSPPLSKAFLIRCWQHEGQWRFMIEDVATRERQLFVGLAHMVERLTAILDPLIDSGDNRMKRSVEHDQG